MAPSLFSKETYDAIINISNTIVYPRQILRCDIPNHDRKRAPGGRGGNDVGDYDGGGASQNRKNASSENLIANRNYTAVVFGTGSVRIGAGPDKKFAAAVFFDIYVSIRGLGIENLLMCFK